MKNISDIEEAVKLINRQLQDEDMPYRLDANWYIRHGDRVEVYLAQAKKFLGLK